jgi:hypothetical protein
LSEDFKAVVTADRVISWTEEVFLFNDPSSMHDRVIDSIGKDTLKIRWWLAPQYRASEQQEFIHLISRGNIYITSFPLQGRLY